MIKNIKSFAGVIYTFNNKNKYLTEEKKRKKG